MKTSYEKFMASSAVNPIKVEMALVDDIEKILDPAIAKKRVLTEQAKKIRKYYVKLENINNKIIKNAIENNNQILFNQDQINTSNRLIEHFGNKKDIFYMFSFRYLQEWYAKFGIVSELREFHNRIIEHQREFENICFHSVMQCCY